MLESDWIEWLKTNAPRGEGVQIGIGDDAAVLAPTSGSIVACSDMLLDGVHFRLTDHDPERIGHKALAVNLSDIAAMAATPLAAMVSIALPRESAQARPEDIYRGILRLADRFDVSLIGGDTTSWDGPLVLDVSVLGRAGNQVWSRSGAQPGDAIGVTGSLGGSLLGHHLSFTPRLAEAHYLVQHYRVTSAIDISDGLAIDLWRLVEAGNCHATIQANDIPISDAARELAARDGRSALDHAVADGEDFELLFTAPQAVLRAIVNDSQLATPVSIIGVIEAGQGVDWVDESGRRTPLPRRGFQHEW